MRPSPRRCQRNRTMGSRDPVPDWESRSSSSSLASHLGTFGRLTYPAAAVICAARFGDAWQDVRVEVDVVVYVTDRPHISRQAGRQRAAQ